MHEESSIVDSVSRNVVTGIKNALTNMNNQNNKAAENGSENDDSVNTNIYLGEVSTSSNLNVVDHTMAAEISLEIVEELGIPKHKRVP